MTAATLLVELLTEELPPKALSRLGEVFSAQIHAGLAARVRARHAPRNGATDSTSISSTLQANTASIGATTCIVASSEASASAVPGHQRRRPGQGPATRHCCCGEARYSRLAPAVPSTSAASASAKVMACTSRTRVVW